ncbi:ribonuclease R [candidate division KSB3 bacterium]|uniref:Ribonuclease R n=1 Tax=candidate division KSB3 bacterium TaxID=2044937 RepID=A0A9D5Q449_9BACT|nr:ribonuclease R [candidate division KSB3 bacterium]MBD3323354.1 ribonuclease R [candidate division KSB3 bacterium]
MIDKATILHFLQTSPPQPIAEKALIQRLGIDSDHRHHFKKLLRELIASGDVIELKKKRVGLPEHLNLVVGHVQAHRKGFAFVIPNPPTDADLYISPDDLGSAVHGDLVVARVKRKKSGKLVEGEILRILQRGQTRVIGTYHDHGDYGFVLPEDSRLPYKVFIDASNALDARQDQIVVAQILRHDEHHRHPDGEIVEILGFPNTAGMDEKIVIHAHGLPSYLPSRVLEAAAAIPDRIPDAEIQRRLDLRESQTFTIDGENARDFDDAVSIERLPNANYKLGVHISDVSYYVGAESLLDQEAYQRGTSVYFPDRAIPMFPERLSSEICCLREGQDRLTLSVFMEFDPTMKLVQYDIRPSVIRSHARFTYTLVRQLLQDEDAALTRYYDAFLPSLRLMKELSELLLQKRMQRGSLDFDLPEPEIVLDMQGRVEQILKAERNLAHRIIEEFMIAANETVAAHLSWMQLPMIYRTHESPHAEKIAALDDFLGTLGVRLQRAKQLHPKDIQRLLKRVQSKPIEHLVNKLTLRSMKQARYTIKNAGHFGLASSCYTHFTSPIRRYPDLIVHRLLRDTWHGRGFSEHELEQQRHALEAIADHSSLRERIAVEAEREIVLIKKLRFMQDKIGDVFNGVISGVAAFGIFVELQEYFVEGLIHVSTLYDDHYHYREETYSLVGEQFRKTYRVGDSVKVQIANVDVAKRTIDFLLL